MKYLDMVTMVLAVVVVIGPSSVITVDTEADNSGLPSFVSDVIKSRRQSLESCFVGLHVGPGVLSDQISKPLMKFLRTKSKRSIWVRIPGWT